MSLKDFNDNGKNKCLLYLSKETSKCLIPVPSILTLNLYLYLS